MRRFATPKDELIIYLDRILAVREWSTTGTSDRSAALNITPSIADARPGHFAMRIITDLAYSCYQPRRLASRSKRRQANPDLPGKQRAGYCSENNMP